MVIKKPIYCPNCKKIVFDDEKMLEYYYSNEDLICPYCKTIVISYNNIYINDLEYGRKTKKIKKYYTADNPF